MTDLRSDPLSTALACVRRLSDEGLEQLARAVAEERDARYGARLDGARWRGTRLFARPGRLRSQVCLVWPVGGGSMSGFSGYYPTRCGETGYGVQAEPEAITCKACLAAGAADDVARLRALPEVLPT